MEATNATRVNRWKAMVFMAAAIGCWIMFWGTIGAEDQRQRKPLPTFLRSARLADRYLSTRNVDELLQFERVEPVCLQLLKRPGVPQQARREALARLATLRHSDPVAQLLPWIKDLDTPPSDSDLSSSSPASGPADGERSSRTALNDLATLLPEQPAAALKDHRSILESLAIDGKRAVTRQSAWIALIKADQSIRSVWPLVEQRPRWLHDLVQGLRWLPQEGMPREEIYRRVEPLLDGWNLRAASDETMRVARSKIRRSLLRHIGLLQVDPENTFRKLAELVAQDVHPDACVASLVRIPTSAWDKRLQVPLAEGLLRYLGSLPLEQRTQTSAKQSIQVAEQLADRLPSQQATRIRRELQSLIIRELIVRTVEEKMTYDQKVLVVQAAQGVQLRLINGDIMPHNLVIVDSPEARESVGMAADRMQNQPGALEKGYLPESDAILHATRLLQPREEAVLTFTAPEQSGTYAYVCTFPGHWSKMYGALLVVDDLNAYLAAHPTLPDADDLLGIQTVNWQYSQLVSQLDAFTIGRSYENGRHNFLKTSCYSCHQMNGEGGRIGPELTKIGKTYKTPQELLKHIMKPSAKVEEQYATAIIETHAGEVLRGVIVNETERALHFTENPLDACDARIVNKQDVAAVTRSQLSPMPEGLLNTLVTPGDVMDLLAYLMSGGDKKHDLFRTPK